VARICGLVRFWIARRRWRGYCTGARQAQLPRHRPEEGAGGAHRRPRSRAPGRKFLADLDSLTETKVEQDDKRFLLRSPPHPAAKSRALRLPLRRRAAAHPAPSQRGLIATPSICRCSANASMRRGFSQTLSKMSLTRNLAANSLVWHVSVHFRKRSPAPIFRHLPSRSEPRLLSRRVVRENGGGGRYPHEPAFYDCP